MCFINCLKRLGKVFLLLVALYLFIGFLIGCLAAIYGDLGAFTTLNGWKTIGYVTVGWPVMLFVMFAMAKAG